MSVVSMYELLKWLAENSDFVNCLIAYEFPYGLLRLFCEKFVENSVENSWTTEIYFIAACGFTICVEFRELL